MPIDTRLELHTYLLTNTCLLLHAYCYVVPITTRLSRYTPIVTRLLLWLSAYRYTHIATCLSLCVQCYAYCCAPIQTLRAYRYVTITTCLLLCMPTWEPKLCTMTNFLLIILPMSYLIKTSLASLGYFHRRA